MIDLILIDDNELLCVAMKITFENTPNFNLVGAFGIPDVEQIIRLNPQVVLVDLSLPEQNGIDVIRRIKRGLPSTAVLAFTCHTEKKWVFDALEAGADGYVLKDSSIEMIVRAIEYAATGRKWMDPVLTAEVA